MKKKKQADDKSPIPSLTAIASFSSAYSSVQLIDLPSINAPNFHRSFFFFFPFSAYNTMYDLFYMQSILCMDK